MPCCCASRTRVATPVASLGADRGIMADGAHLHTGSIHNTEQTQCELPLLSVFVRTECHIAHNRPSRVGRPVHRTADLKAEAAPRNRIVELVLQRLFVTGPLLKVVRSTVPPLSKPTQWPVEVLQIMAVLSSEAVSTEDPSAETRCRSHRVLVPR